MFCTYLFKYFSERFSTHPLWSLDPFVVILDMAPEDWEVCTLKSIQLVKRRGRNPACFDDYCLTVACVRGNLEVVKYLIGRGFGVQDNYFLLMQVACQSRVMDVIEYLLVIGADDWEVYGCSVVQGYKDMLEYIIKRNYNLDYINRLIKIACRANNPEIIKCLLFYGARTDDPELLIIACSNGSFPVIECLVNYGAKLQAPEILIKACETGNLEIVKYLVERGARENVSEALEETYKTGNLKIIKYLLRQELILKDT